MARRNTPMVLSIPWVLGWVSLSVMGPYLMLKVIYKTIIVIFSHFFDRKDKFQGKVVLITGASSGLGKALAHALYKRGCSLVLASRNVEALEELKQDLIQEYTPPELHVPIVLRLDLEDLNSIPDFVEKVEQNCGRVDILINNAGVSYRGEIASTDVSLDVKVMLVNYFGQVALTKAVLKGMLSRNSGQIIAISSLQGKMALPFRSCYCVSKHALQAFFDSLRAEISNTNIQVTVVSPGYIDTNLSQNALHGSTESGHFETKSNVMDVSVVAERITKTCITKESDVVIAPLLHRFAVYLRVLSPSMYFYILKERARRMRLEEKSVKKIK